MSTPGRSQALFPEHEVRRVADIAPGRSQALIPKHEVRKVTP